MSHSFGDYLVAFIILGIWIMLVWDVGRGFLKLGAKAVARALDEVQSNRKTR